jgi:hypothetical protein
MMSLVSQSLTGASVRFITQRTEEDRKTHWHESWRTPKLWLREAPGLGRCERAARSLWRWLLWHARRARGPLAAIRRVCPLRSWWWAVVHQEDEILALVRNDVVTNAAGQRTWEGSFVNTNRRTLREVAVTVDFVDNQDRTVGQTEAEAAALESGMRLDLQAPLPPDAARMRIYSVQWRMDTSAADRWLRTISPTAYFGPFRESWEFGYLMVDPAQFER